MCIYCWPENSKFSLYILAKLSFFLPVGGEIGQLSVLSHFPCLPGSSCHLLMEMHMSSVEASVCSQRKKVGDSKPKGSKLAFK